MELSSGRLSAVRSKGPAFVIALSVVAILLAAVAPGAADAPPAVLAVVATLQLLVAVARPGSDATAPAEALLVAHVPARAPPKG